MDEITKAKLTISRVTMVVGGLLAAHNLLWVLLALAGVALNMLAIPEGEGS